MTSGFGAADMTGRCQGCGHRIWCAASLARGYSARCWRLRKVRAIETAIAPYSAAQQDKALTLMARGGIRPTSDPRIWLADSSDGTTVYIIRDGRCPCRGAKYGCYHEAAYRAAKAVLLITKAA
jgi:hypothetical protein